MFKEKLQQSLKADDSEANRRRWQASIIERKTDMRTLMPLLDEDRFTQMRFLWLTGGLVETAPEIVRPVVADFFAKRHTIAVPNYNRSLAKFFWLAGIPEELEAEATDELFGWILDAKTTTSAKSYAVLALHRLTEKYPELKNELKIVIEDQLRKNGTSFEKRAGKVLLQLSMDEL
jgi:hypothetical protein